MKSAAARCAGGLFCALFCAFPACGRQSARRKAWRAPARAARQERTHAEAAGNKGSCAGERARGARYGAGSKVHGAGRGAEVDKRRPRRYNRGMKLEKIQTAATPAEEEFTFGDAPVQGARVGKKGEWLFVRSPRRYKLFTDGTDEVTFTEGGGHFKWARGERDFAAGESYRLESPGEYEVNGKCAFFVRRT